jgi:hypothetical protein
MLGAQSIDQGDTLHVRLLDRLGTGGRARHSVRAVVIAPVLHAGRVVVPPGSVVSGFVTGSGVERSAGKRHWIGLRFYDLAVPLLDSASDSVRTSVAVRLASVDDSRESIDPLGRIVGPPIPSIVREKKDWPILILGAFHPVGALVLAATLEGEMRESHRSVALDAGTELTVVAESGATLDAWTHWTPPPAITSEVNADSIATLAPLRARILADGAPGDIVSLALIGSEVQVRAAFARAGWMPAVPMDVRGDFKTFVKAAAGKGYGAQPMSKLTLGGRPPDLSFEKVADTFTKRHHLRIWRWPGGERVDSDSTLWLVAATHDVGVMFLSHERTFTHRVDPRIDEERDKVVSDLVAANVVTAMSYVTRAAPAGGATVNDGRSPVVTDWRMAVLVLR